MRDEIDVHLGKRVLRRRLLLSLTQQQLASACGVRFQQIQKYECGANRISAHRLLQIAEALDVPVSYFFDGLTTQTAPQAVGAAEQSKAATAEFIRICHELGDEPRRRLLDLAKTLHDNADAT